MDAGRQQPSELERIALVLGKRGALVAHRVMENLDASVQVCRFMIIRGFTLDFGN